MYPSHHYARGQQLLLSDLFGGRFGDGMVVGVDQSIDQMASEAGDDRGAQLGGFGQISRGLGAGGYGRFRNRV